MIINANPLTGIGKGKKGLRPYTCKPFPPQTMQFLIHWQCVKEGKTREADSGSCWFFGGPGKVGKQTDNP
jgi:hypothetical protein